MKLHFFGDVSSVFDGLDAIKNRLLIELCSDGEQVQVISGNGFLEISGTHGIYSIKYQKKAEFFRGLSILIDRIKKGEHDFIQTEFSRFDTCGTMVDVSRNGVLTLQTAKDFIERIALMGLNMLMLYTEDTYQIEQYPWFGYWRVYDFVEDSICLQLPETDEDFYQSAVGFGTFQQLLTDFPAAKLHETIPNFHNTPDRYRALLETLERDPMHRAAQVQPEIEFALARQAEMATIQNALTAGELPLRVTHNDTKLNNVLLDAKTRKALCVIDLDTVMPGSSLYDFGDSIRFGAATAAEDEKDISKMEMSLDRFRVFTRGYVRACPGLTAKELELLPMGAKTMTMECGVRFLTDYLDGDHYFAVHRDGQNLDRARTQFKLVADMEKKWDEMRKIVEEESR